MPIIGWFASGGDTLAYLYLLKVIEDSLPADRLTSELIDIEFEDVTCKMFSLGIVALRIGVKLSATTKNQWKKLKSKF